MLRMFRVFPTLCRSGLWILPAPTEHSLLPMYYRLRHGRIRGNGQGKVSFVALGISGSGLVQFFAPFSGTFCEILGPPESSLA